GRDGSDVPIPPSRIREIADLGADIAAMRAAILDQRTALAGEIRARSEAQAALERRNRDLETLFSIASHDLREPLRAIRSFSSILLENVEGLTAEGRDFAQRIHRAGNRLDALIESLLQLARAQREAAPEETV